MEKYFDARDLIRERILNKCELICNKETEYSEDIVKDYQKIKKSKKKLDFHVYSELRSLYYYLDLIFGTFSPEKNYVHDLDENEKETVPTVNHRTPYYAPILREYNDEQPKPWLKKCYQSFENLIRVFALATYIFATHNTSKTTMITPEFDFINNSFHEISKLIPKCNSKKDFDKISKEVKNLYKRYSKGSVTVYLKGTYKKKAYIRELFSFDISDNNDNSITKSYDLLGNANTFINSCPVVKDICDKGKKRKNKTFNTSFLQYADLIKSFKIIYNFYHQLIIGYLPFLGQLNKEEIDFINYLLDTFLPKFDCYAEKVNVNENRAMFNKMKEEDWTIVPPDVRNEIIKHIDEITFSDKITSSADISEGNFNIDDYDYSRINKYIQAENIDGLFQKLTHIKFKIETPKRFVINEALKEIENSMCFLDVDEKLYKYVNKRLQLIKNRIKKYSTVNKLDDSYTKKLECEMNIT